KLGQSETLDIDRGAVQRDERLFLLLYHVLQSTLGADPHYEMNATLPVSTLAEVRPCAVPVIGILILTRDFLRSVHSRPECLLFRIQLFSNPAFERRGGFAHIYRFPKSHLIHAAPVVPTGVIGNMLDYLFFDKLRVRGQTAALTRRVFRML